MHERGERVEQGIERRELHDLELRVEGDGMTLRGYAAVFNSASQPLPFIERIEPGAFRDSLKSRNDVKLLWNHDTSIVLGSTRASTLKLTEDERGVEYRDLVMQPDGMQDSASFKGEVASKFLADGLDVIFVVENNAEEIGRAHV